jgi:hypothetical protein
VLAVEVGMKKGNCLSGCTITLGPSIQQKSQLHALIRKNGGNAQPYLADNTTHFLLTKWEDKAYQCDPRTQSILKIEYLHHSIESQQLLEESPYRIYPRDVSSEEELVFSTLKKAHLQLCAVSHCIHNPTAQLPTPSKTLKNSKASLRSVSR